MSMTMEKISVSCPQCGQQLVVPASALGKQGRCPSCKHIFALELPVAAQLVEPPPQPSASQAPNSIWDEMSKGDYTLKPLDPSPSPMPAAPNPYVSPAAQATKGRYQHGFGWEHRGWDAGMMGGLAMMAIAAVWFIGGWMCGIIFYYPPILFIIGLIGFFKGLVTGNISGR